MDKWIKYKNFPQTSPNKPMGNNYLTKFDKYSKYNTVLVNIS